jgi:hypothetical protein
MTPAICTAWAIKAPNGMILYNTFADTYDECVYSYCCRDIATWDRIHDKQGFRCVKVEVREVE